MQILCPHGIGTVHAEGEFIRYESWIIHIHFGHLLDHTHGGVVAAQIVVEGYFHGATVVAHVLKGGNRRTGDHPIVGDGVTEIIDKHFVGHAGSFNRKLKRIYLLCVRGKAGGVGLFVGVAIGWCRRAH